MKEVILTPEGHEKLNRAARPGARAGRLGEEALRHLLHDEFAAILLDVQMPGLDGFQTAELIKDRERTRTVPILFLTAISKDAEHVFRGYDVGAVDYLMKPFDPQILRAKVAVFIDLWEKSVELRRREALESQQALATLEQESELRYRSLADAVPQLVWTTDADGQTTYFNERWYEYTGSPAGDLGGARNAIQPDDLARALEVWESSRRVGRGLRDRVPRCDARTASGAGTWRGQCPYRARTARSPAGSDGDRHRGPPAGARSGSDSSPRRAGCSGARSTTSATSARSRAWPSGGSPTSASSTCSSTVTCSGSSSSTPIRRRPRGRELEQAFPPVAGRRRDGHPRARLGDHRGAVGGAGLDEPQRELVDELGLRSYICAPLLARERVLGAITFVQAESGRVDGIAQLELARQLASRAALAVDNAHLYEEAERRAQAARVLAEVGDAVFLVDREGSIRLWNKAAEAITSLAAADVVGRPIDEVLPSWAQLAPLIPVASGPGELVRAETAPLDLGGRELWVSGSGVGIDDGTIYAFRDLTEERALETLKAEFVATVSHELRTPLAAIYGAAQTIRRSDIELDQEVRGQLLDVIATESDRLGAIVSDLLVAGRLDADELPVSIEPLDPVELAGSVLDTARAHLPEAIDLELRAGDGVGAVAADAGQLRQVLVNLVDNAIKYSPGGGPRRGLDRQRPRRRPLRGRRPRPRHPAVRAPADLREVLPPRSGDDPRDRRHRARPLHLPRARPPHGREDLGRVEARRGLDLRRRAAGRKRSAARAADSRSRRRDSNPRPPDYKSVALPAELLRPRRLSIVGQMPRRVRNGHGPAEAIGTLLSWNIRRRSATAQRS